MDSVGHTITPIKYKESQSIIDKGLTNDEAVQIINGKDDFIINELHNEALERILEIFRKHNTSERPH